MAIGLAAASACFAGMQLERKIAATDWAGIRGANYIPSYASNTYEIWRNYDHEIFDRELRLVRGIGYNTVRLWLNYRAFEELGSRMADRLADALRLCAKYKLRAVLNLFDSCGVRPRVGSRWMTALAAYNLFQTGSRFTSEQKAMMRRLFDGYVHGYGAETLVPVAEDSPMMVLLWQNWQATPGNDRLAPSFYPRIDAYVDAVVGRVKDDPGVLVWDMMNEPEFASEGPISPKVFITPETEKARDEFLDHLHDLFKRNYPNEAVTVGWATLADAVQYAALSDVLTFHIYGDAGKLRATLDEAAAVGRKTGKRVLITETLANWDFGSPAFGSMASDEAQLAHYQNVLPVLVSSPIGWIAWGMIVNRSFDPFTDILYPNGLPRPAAVYLRDALKTRR